MIEKKQLVSLLLLALFIGWQTDAVIHFLFTPHSIDEHGHAVHTDTEPDHSSHCPDGDDKHDHEDCRFLAFLVSGKASVNDEPSPINVVDPPEDPAFFAFEETPVLRGSDLYKLSPCNSPPYFF